MSKHSGAHPDGFPCPLCGHAQQMTQHNETLCPHCGAALHIFHEYTAANQYAESRKAAEESARIERIAESNYWVVGHKWTPPGQLRRDAA